MKYFKILYLMIVIFMAIGCSNDDNALPTEEQLILGDWIITKMSISGDMTGNESGYDWIWLFKYYPIPVQAFIENQNYIVNFSNLNQVASNGNLKTSYVAFVDDYVNAYEYSKVIENIDVFKNGEWTIDDIFLTVTNNGASEKYPIIELTNNKLTILKHLKDNVVLNHEIGEIDCNTNLDLYLTFQKN